MANPVWVDNVTPLNSTNMTLLQTRDEKNVPSGYVGLDATKSINLNGYYARTGTGTTIAFATAETGDSVNRWLVDINGKINWGPGNAVADTNLYRNGAGSLRTDGAFSVGNGFVVTGYAVVSTDLYLRGNSSHIYFGAADDTNLYRSAAGTLKTDGWMIVGGGAVVDAGGTGANLYFGSAYDTNLYRNGASSLRTNAQVWVEQALYTNMALTSDKTIYVGQSGGSPGVAAITFGNDSIISRAAAFYLRTNCAFQAGQSMMVDFSDGGNKLYFGSAGDTNLYRSGAGTLKTDSSLVSGGQFYANTFARANATSAGNEVILGLNNSSFTAGPYIAFGTNGSWDTNLYRKAAADLVTDGSFEAFSGLWGRVSLSNVAVGAYVTGETTDRWEVLGSGRMQWGPGGTASADTYLYRLGAGILKTDGRLDVATRMTIGIDNVSKLWFGSNDDTSLYRSAAGVLKTDTDFYFVAKGGLAANQTGLIVDGAGVALGMRVLIGPANSAGAGLRSLCVAI